MSEDRKIQVGVAVDSSEAKKGFDEVKQGARDMAQSVSQSGKQAGDGMGSIGAGGDASAQKIDKSTKSIINSIQRTTAAMEAGSRGSSSYFENLAKQRGANVDVLKPYLEQLDAAAAKQNVASASLGEMGMSAKQTAYAMRGVPAQFTDIFVSIASGQRPMMVMLQQGGQLKDMFGGIGNAAKALGTYAIGLVNPFTIAAAAVAGLGTAYYQGSQEADAYNKALILTGNTAGTTSAELQQMAQRIAATTGGTQGAAAEALAQLAGTGKIAAENLSLVSEAAINMERATGTAVSDTVKQFEELGRAPVEASLKLNDQYKYLTSSIYEQIKALETEGRTAEAAALAQKAYADALNDRSGQIKQNLGAIESAWKGLKDAAKGAWDAMLDIGRQGDPLQNAVDKVASLRKSIEEMESGPYGGSFLSKSRADAQRSQLAAAEKTLESLQKEVSEKEKSRIATEETNKAEQARITWLKEGDKYLSQQVKMEAEIAKARNQGAAAGASSVEIEKRIAEIRKQYDKPKSNIDAGTKNDFAQIMAAQLDMAKNAARSEIEIIKDKVAQQVMTEQQGAEQVYAIQQQAATKQAELLKQQLAGTKDAGDREKIRAQIQQLGNEAAQAGEKYKVALAKISAADLKNTQDYMKSVGDETASLLEKAKAAEAENNTIGMTAEQLAYLTAARYDEQIAVKQATIDSIKNVEGREAEVALIEEQISALERLKSAAVQKPVLQANKKAAEDAAREWQKSADEINRSLTDALMRGFESGKDFASNLKDTVVNMFKTMVLRPVISAVLSPVSGAITTGMGAMGLSGTSNAANAANAASTASSAYNLYNSAFTPGGAIAGSSLYSAGSFFGSSSMMGYGAGVEAASLGAVGSGATVIGAADAAAGSAAFAEGAAAASSGFGSALAAIPGWGWAAMAALAVFGSGMFDSKGGPKTEGDYFGTIGQDGKLTQSDTATFGGDAYTGHSADAQMADLAPALGTSIASAITALGGDATGLGINFGYNTDPQGDAPDNIMAGVTDAQGNLLYRSWRDVERGQASDELQKEVPRMILASLQGTDLSSVFDPLLDSLGNVADMTDEQVNKALAGMQTITNASAESVAKVFGEAFDISKFSDLSVAGESTIDTFIRLSGVFETTNAIAEMLGKDVSSAFGEIGLASADMRQALIDGAGGMEALSNKASFFYQNFYTDAERSARSVEVANSKLNAAFDAIGMAVPATHEQFRDLVASLDLSTQSGQSAYQSMMNITGAFITVHGAASDVKSATESASAAMASLASQLSAIGSLRVSVTDAINSVSADSGNYKPGLVTANTRLDEARANLANASGVDEQIKAGNALKDAIMARYQAEREQIARQKEAEASAGQAAVDASNRAGQAAVDAANLLNSALRKVGDYAKSLLTGSLSALSEPSKAAEVNSQYVDLLAKARSGDVEAIGNIQGVANDLLKMSQDSASTSLDYARQFGAVQGALSDLGSHAGADQTFNPQVYAESTSAYQQSDLDLQKSTVSELESLNKMLSEWQASIASGLPASSTQAVTSIASSVVSANTPEQSALSTALPTFADIQASTLKELEKLNSAAADWHSDISFRLADFAISLSDIGVGIHDIGDNTSEVGVIVATSIEAAQSARESAAAAIENAKNSAAIAEEIRQLRAELRAQNSAIAQNTMETAKVIRQWEGDGMPSTRTLV